MENFFSDSGIENSFLKLEFKNRNKNSIFLLLRTMFKWAPSTGLPPTRRILQNRLKYTSIKYVIYEPIYTYKFLYLGSIILLYLCTLIKILGLQSFKNFFHAFRYSTTILNIDNISNSSLYLNDNNDQVLNLNLNNWFEVFLYFLTVI